MKNWKEVADSQMVCYCKNVTKGTIVDAIKNDVKTLQDIQKNTTAGTGETNAKQRTLQESAVLVILMRF